MQRLAQTSVSKSYCASLVLIYSILPPFSVQLSSSQFTSFTFLFPPEVLFPLPQEGVSKWFPNADLPAEVEPGHTSRADPDHPFAINLYPK